MVVLLQVACFDMPEAVESLLRLASWSFHRACLMPTSQDGRSSGEAQHITTSAVIGKIAVCIHIIYCREYMIVHMYQATITSTRRFWDHLEIINAWAVLDRLYLCVNVAEYSSCLAEMSQEKPRAKTERVIQRLVYKVQGLLEGNSQLWLRGSWFILKQDKPRTAKLWECSLVEHKSIHVDIVQTLQITVWVSPNRNIRKSQESVHL